MTLTSPTRWFFALRIAVRSLRRSRGQALLVLATIAVPVVVATTAATASSSLVVSPVRQLDFAAGPRAAAWVDAYRGPGLVQSPTGIVRDSGKASTTAPPAVVAYEEELRATLRPGQDLHRLRTTLSRWTTDDGRHRDGFYVELDLANSDIAAAFPLAAGRLPQRIGEIVVNHDLGAELGIVPGDVLTAAARPGVEDPDHLLPTTTVTVVGVARPVASTEPAYIAAALPGSGLPAPEGVWDGPSVRWIIAGAPVAWDQVQAINSVGSAVLSRAVLTDPPPASHVPFPDPLPALSGQDAALIGIVGVGVILLAALLVAPAFAVSVRRSQRELALLSAVGAQRRDLRRIVVLQGAGSGVTATAGGIAVGIGLVAVTRAAMHLAGSVTMPDLHVPWSGITAVAGITIIAPTAAAWWPARQAANQDPVAARSGRTTALARKARGRSLLPAGVGLAGTVIAVGGVVTSSPVLLAVAAIVLLAGTLGLLGGWVGLVARLAPRLGTAWRYALRDADRRRSRTVPAVAGVMAAVAIAVGAAGFSAANDAHQEAVYGSPTGPGTVRVSASRLDSTATPTPAQWDSLDQALAAELPTTSIDPITIGMAADGEGTVWLDVASTTRTPLPTLIGDRFHPSSWAPEQDPNTPLVDDGTTVAHLGIPGAERAAAALAAGKLVVRFPQQVSADGTATIGIGHGTQPRDVTVPAVAVDLGTNALRMIVPPSMTGELDLRPVQRGLLATLSDLPDADAEAHAQAALDAIAPGIEVAVERGYVPTGTGWTVALSAGAALIAAASAGMCVTLAAADAQADLATLAAIGSPRRLRRGIAMAQGAVILALGTVLGTILGMLFATAVVLGRRLGAEGIDPTWSIHWPWPVIVLLVAVVPAMTLGGAWLLTPARLPLTRRLAD